MPKTILIIEDEEIIRNLLQRRLVDEGYRVLTAKNGEDGISVVKRQTPDLILLDIVMPKKDGFEVLEELHSDENLRSIPVIIISNSGQPMELERAKGLGVRDWLVKIDFDPQEVLDKVKKQINDPLAKTSR